MPDLTKADQKKFDEWRYLTERLRQQRVRFRPHCVREILAWLIVLRNRYRRSLLSLREEHRDDNDPWVKGSEAKFQDRIEHLDALFIQVMDNWRGRDWWEAVKQVEEMLAQVDALPAPAESAQAVNNVDG